MDHLMAENITKLLKTAQKSHQKIFKKTVMQACQTQNTVWAAH